MQTIPLILSCLKSIQAKRNRSLEGYRIDGSPTWSEYVSQIADIAKRAERKSREINRRITEYQKEHQDFY